jgi:hypothetical protein
MDRLQAHFTRRVGRAGRGRGQTNLQGTLRADVSASVVVFLVAVPLSLGIALASGAPIMAGLVAAVVGGVVAGLVGGSSLQVTGPAAGLTVVVAELVARFVTIALVVAWPKVAGRLRGVPGPLVAVDPCWRWPGRGCPGSTCPAVCSRRSRSRCSRRGSGRR